MSETGTREEPLRSYNFVVEIDGITLASFSEASGLSTEGEIVEYREGTDGDLTVRKLPGLRTYANIQLRRGMTTNRELWRWRLSIINGILDRRNGAVILLDELRRQAAEWRFVRGWPVRYEGPGLNAAGNEVAIESFEIAHEGLVLV